MPTAKTVLRTALIALTAYGIAMRIPTVRKLIAG